MKPGGDEVGVDVARAARQDLVPHNDYRSSKFFRHLFSLLYDRDGAVAVFFGCRFGNVPAVSENGVVVLTFPIEALYDGRAAESQKALLALREGFAVLA